MSELQELLLHVLVQLVVIVAAARTGAWLLRPWLTWVTDYLLLRGNGELSVLGLSIVLILVFLSAIATSVIGIFAIFGPFVLGAVCFQIRPPLGLP